MNQSAAYVAAYGGEGSSTRVPAKLDRNQQGLRSATFGGPSRSDVGKRKIIPNAVQQLVQKRNFVEGTTKKQGTAGGETGPLRHTHPSIRRSGSTRDPKPGSHALNNGLAHAREHLPSPATRLPGTRLSTPSSNMHHERASTPHTAHGEPRPSRATTDLHTRKHLPLPHMRHRRQDVYGSAFAIRHDTEDRVLVHHAQRTARQLTHLA
jgi:hypothetical protein